MELIKTRQELDRAISQLRTAAFVTVDTEFIRETTFWPELCLIQLASPDTTALIDPLSPDLDLEPVFELMRDQSVIKVFHAARQDIEIIYHLSGSIPTPVFDTQVAAMVCGFGDSISYDQLVLRITGEKIDKTSRFTNWRHRPLTDRQLEYALADVTHLIPVYKHLVSRLDNEQRADWLTEEMSILTSVETYDLHPDDAWKRLKMRARKPIELAVLRSIAAWREREAREKNVPRGRILKDDILYEVAQQHPRDIVELARLRGIAKGWEKSSGATGMLAAVNDALALPKEKLPKLPKPPTVPEGTPAAVELIRVFLKLVSDKQGVASKLIATSDEIERLAAEGENANTPSLSGWRRQVFGEDALKLLRGELALRFKNRHIEVFPVDEQTDILKSTKSKAGT